MLLWAWFLRATLESKPPLESPCRWHLAILASDIKQKPDGTRPYLTICGIWHQADGRWHLAIFQMPYLVQSKIGIALPWWVHFSIGEARGAPWHCGADTLANILLVLEVPACARILLLQWSGMSWADLLTQRMASTKRDISLISYLE